MGFRNWRLENMLKDFWNRMGQVHKYPLDVKADDEVHQRTMYSDVLLGLLKDVIKQRSDIRLVLMSSTMEMQRLQAYFPGAPILNMPGHTHEVDIHYLAKPEKDRFPLAITFELLESHFPISQGLSGTKTVRFIKRSGATWALKDRGQCDLGNCVP